MPQKWQEIIPEDSQYRGCVEGLWVAFARWVGDGAGGESLPCGSQVRCRPWLRRFGDLSGVPQSGASQARSADRAKDSSGAWEIHCRSLLLSAKRAWLTQECAVCSKGSRWKCRGLTHDGLSFCPLRTLWTARGHHRSLGARWQRCLPSRHLYAWNLEGLNGDEVRIQN